jgi:hypothetical protein
MFLHVNEVKYLKEYKLYLKFNDGMEGQVDLKAHLWGKVFEPLKEKEYFSQVRLDQELGTICWANDADFAPEFLHKNLSTKIA